MAKFKRKLGPNAVRGVDVCFDCQVQFPKKINRSRPPRPFADCFLFRAMLLYFYNNDSSILNEDSKFCSTCYNRLNDTAEYRHAKLIRDAKDTIDESGESESESDRSRVLRASVDIFLEQGMFIWRKQVMGLFLSPSESGVDFVLNFIVEIDSQNMFVCVSWTEACQ